MSRTVPLHRLLTNSTVLQHTMIWVAIFIGYTFMLSFYGGATKRLLINVLTVPLFMTAYYLLKYVQIPHLLNRGKRLLFVISFLGSSVLLFAMYTLGWIVWLDEVFDLDGKIPFLKLGSFLILTVRFYSPALAILAWESHHQRRKERERMHQLETQKLASELKYLKAQINPHFLFNTLNNLYSYVLSDSPKAPDMILKLSGILRYVLNKSQNPAVPLQEELAAIEHFMGLEQIRYGDRLQVNYRKTGNLSVPISPLILLSLVENAFKHGASGDVDQPRIEIQVEERDRTIRTWVWNTKSQYRGELNDAYKEGIGLKNIQRQLDLIYPNRHTMVITDQEKSFEVLLTITTEL